MKKLYTLALATLCGASMAFAQGQALQLNNTYVYRTAKLLPEGTMAVDGTTPLVGDWGQNLTELNGAAFIDADYNTFPLQGGGAASANYQHLENDYTDPETGVHFAKGVYACLNSNSEYKMSDALVYTLGLKNLDKIIFYLAGSGSLQVNPRVMNNEGERINFEENWSTNRKIKNYYAPGFWTVDWLDRYFAAPLKVVVDIKGANQYTPAELQAMGDPEVNVPGKGDCPASDFSQANPVQGVSEYTLPIAFYTIGGTVDGKESPSDTKIEWSADNNYVFSFKRSAMIMAVAVVASDPTGETKYFNLDSADPQWLTAAESGIENVVAAPEAAKSVEAIYNLNGQKVSEYAKGVNIVRYSDGSAKKVVIK